MPYFHVIFISSHLKIQAIHYFVWLFPQSNYLRIYVTEPKFIFFVFLLWKLDFALLFI